MSRLRPSREEIIERYRACERKLGRTPGQASFCKMAGIARADIFYYWPAMGNLTQEACGTRNEFVSATPDNEVFADYARVCIHLNKIPTRNELRIATRELGTRTHCVYGRFGSIVEFDRRFREWLLHGSEGLRAILSFQGWQRTGRLKPLRVSEPHISFHPFLPAGLQYLDALSRGELPPHETADASASVMFERKCGDAFRALGFEVTQLGQGKGRVPDLIAIARRYGYGIIVDAKSRKDGYRLGTDDRTFHEYVTNLMLRLEQDGIQKGYLAVVASQFCENDLKKLGEYLTGSKLRGITLFSASGLMRIVEESIRDRSKFDLGEFEKMLFGNRIVAA